METGTPILDTAGGRKPPPKLVAVIDIGATAIRMAVAEIAADGQIRKLESLVQDVSLGKDTFTKGAIKASTTEDCVRVLKAYRRLLNEYGITRPDQIHVVATSAVREATNRLSFMQRLYVGTGFQVEPFDEAAVSRVTYLGVQPLLESEPQLAAGKTLVVEVGGGSTEVLLLQGGDIAFSDTYRLGSLRLRKMLETYHAPVAKVRNIMESHIQRIANHVRRHVPSGHDLRMLALGGDIRFAASQLLSDWKPPALAEISVPGLRLLTDEVLALSVDELVHERHLTFPDAESVGPALLTYVQLAHALGLDGITVSSINLRDGLIKQMVYHEAWTETFVRQIIHSATDFGRRLGFDEAHGRHVAGLCRTLFRSLQPVHQLDAHHEVVLYVAALLHDIGYAVSARSHHKHTMYLILNGELFGLNKRDVLLAALTARYHRHSSPKPIHEGFASLDLDSRANVVKMAAILRIADALDRTSSQRIQNIRCSREHGRLVITVPTGADLSLEQLAVQQKESLFREVFGMPVLLRNAPA